MKRIVGVIALLVILYAVLLARHETTWSGLSVVANRQGFYGIITIGAALLIITGGIDLSIGSVVGFGAVLFAVLMEKGVHPYAAVGVVVAAGVVIGLINGLLVTRLKLQAFLVTLCGMFVYRGLARQLTGSFGLSRVKEAQPDFTPAVENLRYALVGKSPDGALAFPVQFVIMLVVAAVIGFFLHRTARGRHWYAIGYNEQAAKYAGVNVNRQRIIVYMICSALASFAGVLHLLDYSSLKADEAGSSFELQAITGAAAIHFAHKLHEIDDILATYPALLFVLLGDSGQEDARIYREVVRRHPGRIRAIYIRDVQVPARAALVGPVIKELAAEGVPMLLVADYAAAAQHAAELGLVE